MELDARNEVAGVVAVGAVIALVALLAGATTLVRAAVGTGGSLGLVAGAVAASVGLAGLLAAWAAVESGYFDPEAAAGASTDDEPGGGEGPGAERGEGPAEADPGSDDADGAAGAGPAESGSGPA